MKRVFSFVIIITMLAGLIFMRNYNIEYMNELIRNNIQRPIAGVDARYLFSVRLDDRIAEYNWSQDFPDFDPLEYNIPLEGNENIFRSPKNDDLFRLVYRDGYKSYGLEFLSFFSATGEKLENIRKSYAEDPSGFSYDPDKVDLSPYEYADILRLIYNVHSAEDIVSFGISSVHNKRSSFYETADRNDINTFYNAVISMKTEDSDINYGASGKHYVTFTLKNGLIIDDLSYSTRDNIFFQRYGAVYSETDQKLNLLMDRLLESASSVHIENKKAVE